MTKSYNKHYQTENLFGKPYPELISFFYNFLEKGELLDMGCGQGRNAIPLARLGFNVTGIDSSNVGIQQMMQSADIENLKLKGIVSDIYDINDFAGYNFILLDSMFHFLKKDREKEVNFVKHILNKSDKNTVIAFCVRHSGNKVKILNETIDFQSQQKRIFDKNIQYIYHDTESGHTSKSDYKIIAIKNS